MPNVFSRWVDRNMPTREGMAENKYLAPIAHRFLSPELWRFTRRSVPRGVALGIFAGFIVPVGQIFLAAFLALPARANVPLSALVTFVTNPFTLPFWLLTANRVGGFVLKIDSETGGNVQAEIVSGWWQDFGWFIQTAGVTAFGFVVMAVVGAATGYLLASFVWRFVVAGKRNRRLRRMAGRRRGRAGPAEG
jgi:uncharacterized protein